MDGCSLQQVSFIEMVDVRQCALDEQALTSMLRAVRANCTLSILHLEGNNLTGKGVFILSEVATSTCMILFYFASFPYSGGHEVQREPQGIVFRWKSYCP